MAGDKEEQGGDQRPRGWQPVPEGPLKATSTATRAAVTTSSAAACYSQCNVRREEERLYLYHQG
ncbi:MAG: hypothetical protein GY696_39860 [Gammaproteobacteria bacterium]|nr:hypothetical protein [Gammaproteobacteria bacterium]